MELIIHLADDLAIPDPMQSPNYLETQIHTSFHITMFSLSFNSTTILQQFRVSVCSNNLLATLILLCSIEKKQTIFRSIKIRRVA